MYKNLAVLVAVLLSNEAIGQWSTILKDTFSGQRPMHYDLSTKLLWGGQTSPNSAFFVDTLIVDDFGLAFKAIGVTPKAIANAQYQSATGLKTSIAVDYPFPFHIDRNLDSVRVSMDMLWDTLLNIGESGRIVAGVMHSYPSGGPAFGSVDSLNSGHPFGRPSYNIRVMNKNGTGNNNLNGVMMHGGGHSRLGDFEIYRSGVNKWWLPGYSTEPGGTSPGSTGSFPFGGCAQSRNNIIASTTKWRRFTWTFFHEMMTLQVRNASEPESSNSQVMQMFIPKVDTLNPGPTVSRLRTFYGNNVTQLPKLYYWFPKLEAFRFFWNAGSNVWLANLTIESTGNSPTTANIQTSNNIPVSVFPNPGNDRLRIQNIKSGAQISVFDGLGRKVYQHQIQADNLEINTADWIHGVYRIVLIENGRLQNISWLKN